MQGSVIYMKKMRNGRKGFTLLEIVAVVAIIVILSTAAFLGVAATLNKASEAQKNLQMNNGDSFEWYARSQVDAYGKSQVTWDPIPNYTPENKAKKIKNHMISEEGWTDGEITFEYQEDGWHIIANWDPTLEEHHGLQTPEDYKLWKSNYDNYLSQGYTEDELKAGIIQGSTDLKPVWDPQNHKGLTYEQYQEELKKQQNGGSQGGNSGGNQGDGNQGGNQSGSPSYGSTGRPSTGTTVYGANDKSNAQNASVSISQKGDQYNSCQIDTKIPHGTKTYVVYVNGAKSNDEFTSYNGTVTNLGNGYYRVTLTWANCSGEQLNSSTCKGVTEAYVVEYSSES